MLLCPSMMCADFSRLGEETDELAAAGADIFHLDVMDGSFVPNFGLGQYDMEAICKRTDVPCDVHLMTAQPDVFIDLAARAGVKIVYVHTDAVQPINSTLLKIAELGMKAGIVVDPGVSFESVRYSLPAVDYVLIMTVNPGFAGQAYLDYVNPKIEEFAARKEELGYQIIIDGACSAQVIKQAETLGADGAVLGTSALFGKGRPYAEIMKDLRRL